MKCKYCQERGKNYYFPKNISGQNFEMYEMANYTKKYMKYKCWIARLTTAAVVDKARLMVSTDNDGACYFDINYCPICGRKV